MMRSLWATETTEITETVDGRAPGQRDETGDAQEPRRDGIPSTTMRDALLARFQSRIAHNPALDRALVSFQGNKGTPFYGWFKYREGFSQSLVAYLLETLKPEPGMLLDPFAGSGAALFAAINLGWAAKGIELLPVGIYAMRARIAAEAVNLEALGRAIAELKTVELDHYFDAAFAPRHIAITRGAYPAATERELAGYLAYCHHVVRDEHVRALLLYAAFCVLEEISYTRKDGQYLRWDGRSGRSQGKKPFNKGHILSFSEAIHSKLSQIAGDLGLRPVQARFFDHMAASGQPRAPELLQGSCLTLLPTMPNHSIDFVMTSPPYANRYDYTRTYALELIHLGCGDDQVKRLRQAMLSCTVENRDKREQLRAYYAQLGRERDFALVEHVFDGQAALHEVLAILDAYRRAKKLNNDHIARLVRNYFYEMGFVIFELARLLKPGGIVAMVNDNVRYAGEEVPVDLILSDLAEAFGLVTRHIWTLGRGKGNSSQQMGHHGRSELRKCVYVWEKAEGDGTR